jgi:hypothetical protein
MKWLRMLLLRRKPAPVDNSDVEQALRESQEALSRAREDAAVAEDVERELRRVRRENHFKEMLVMRIQEAIRD